MPPSNNPDGGVASDQSSEIDEPREVPETLQNLAISVAHELCRVAQETSLRSSRFRDLITMIQNGLPEDFETDDWGWVGRVLIGRVSAELEIEPIGVDAVAIQAGDLVLALEQYVEACLRLKDLSEEEATEGARRDLRAVKRTLQDRLETESLSPYAISLPESFVDRYGAARVEHCRLREAAEAAERESKAKVPQGREKSENLRGECGESGTVGGAIRLQAALGEGGDTERIESARRERPLTEEAIEKIRKAAEATKPPPGGIFKICDGASQTLTEFRVYFETMADQRAWTDVHAFFWLAKFIDTSLWLNISKVQGRRLLTDPLSRASYSGAVQAVWASLGRLTGVDKEREALLLEAQQLIQRKEEGTMAYLYRVNDHKLKCELVGVHREAAHWFSVARVGMRDDLSKKLSYLVRVGKEDQSWEGWLVAMERMAPSISRSGIRLAECAEVVESSPTPPGKGSIEKRDTTVAEQKPKKHWTGGFRGRCYVCDQVGHMKRDCPNRQRGKLDKPREAMAAEGSTDKNNGGGPPAESEDCSKGGSGSGQTVKITTAAFAADCLAAASSIKSYALGNGDDIPQVSLQCGTYRCSALLDSGSSCSLASAAVVDKLMKEDLAVAIGNPPILIRYANGEEEKACGEVIIRASLNDSECFIPCLVVSQLGREGGMILGRRALRLLGISMQFPQDPPEERARLRTAFAEHQAKSVRESTILPLKEEEEKCLCATVECYKTNGELFVPDSAEDTLGCIGQETLRLPGGIRDPLDIQIDAVLEATQKKIKSERDRQQLSEQEVIDVLLSSIVSEEPIPLAEGYTLGLSRESVDGKFTEGQSYQFVAHWTLLDRGEGSRPWSSEKMIERLSDVEKEEFHGHCQEYETQGWWSREPSEDAREEGEEGWQCPYGTIFPVRQAAEGALETGRGAERAVCKTTKTRPVADLRLINAASPCVSNQQHTTAEAARSLRSSLKKTDVVRQYDLSRAFYCIGVEPRTKEGRVIPLRLIVGRRRFRCRRLAFGLACGPVVLRGSQRVVLKVVEAARNLLGYSKEVSITVVMDDFLVWGKAEAVQAIESLMLKTWQTVGFICPEAKRTQWGADEPTRWLGSGWVWDAERGILSLVRPNASEDKLLSKAEELTKRRVFQMAGRYVEISNGVNEGMARAHADCARVLASGSPTWDSVDSDRVWVGPALVHLGLAQKYWKRSAEVEDGDLRLFTDLSCIVADVDASAGGYGFVWRDREGKIVRAEARVQSRSMAVGSWHCNRRELFVIAACLRRLDEEVHLFPHLREVEIRGDSRVAVHQANPWNVPACKSVERRAILRLRGVVAEVTHALNCLTPSVSVKFSHLPGERNGVADALSRVSLSLKYVPVLDGSSAVGIVHCDAVEAHSWLSDQSAGIHSIPSFRRWKALRVAFLGWCGSDAPSPQAELFTKFLLAKQAEDGFCSRVLDECDTSQVSAIPGLPYSFQVREGLLYRVRPNVPIDDGPRWQLVVPRGLVGELSLAVHQECGHAGLTATLAGLYGVAWAPAMRKLARQALRGCLSCALTRDCGSRAQISYGASRIPTAPYDCVGIDMYGPLRRPGNPRAGIGSGLPSDSPLGGAEADGKQVLSVIDRLTGFCSFYLLENGRAKVIADALELHFWRVGRWPKEIWCDNAKSFVEASPLVSFAMMVGCSLRTIPPHTPQCGGFWERKHKEVSETLRACLYDNPEASWKWLVAIAEARANFVSGAHERIFGWKPQSPAVGALSAQLYQQSSVPRSFRGNSAAAVAEARTRSRYRDDLLQVFAEEWLQAREDLATGFMFRMAKRGGQEPLVVGDRVVLYHPKTMQGMKLAPKASGPYFILKKVGSQCYEVGNFPKGSSGSSSQRSWMVHSSRIRKFEGVELTKKMVAPDSDTVFGAAEENICPSCKEVHSGTLVCCDGCDQWFHLGCTDYDGETSWYCAVCGAARE